MANLVILDKVGATDAIYDIVAPAGLSNGNLVVLGAQASNGTYACAACNTIADKSMVLVASVPLSYQVEYTENDYTIETGGIERAYAPVVGRKYSFPVSNFTATVPAAVGKYVIPQANELKMEIVNDLGGTETVAFIIDKVFTKVGVSMMTIRCIKAD